MSVCERMPFPVRTIQVDGGTEFEDAFEAECRRRGIKLFVLPPQSPEMQGHVERAQRTHTEECYEPTDSTFDIAELDEALRTWEHFYDTVQPRQSLGYLAKDQFLQQCHHNRKGVTCHR